MPDKRVDALEKKLAALIEKAEETEETVEILNELAFSCYSNDLERTREYSARAIELAEKLEYPMGQAKGHRTMGIYYWLKGDFEKALECSLKALEISEEMGDENGQAASFNNMGLIYMNLSKPDLARSNHMKAADIFEKVGNRESQGKALTNIGVICEAQGDYNEALKYLLKSLELYEELGIEKDLSGCHSYIGNCYRGLGEYERALEHYHIALENAEKNASKLDTAIAYKGMGALYTRTAEYDKADEYLKKGLELAEEMKSSHQELSIFRFLVELYEARKDFQNALLFYKEIHELESKIFSEENKRKIENLEIKYETEQKEKESQLYKLKSEELERMVAERTAELEKELAERKRAEKVQSVLFNISQSLSTRDSLHELFAAIHAELSKILEAANFYVALYDEASDTYTFPYEVDEKDIVEDYTPQQLKKSLTDYVRRQAEPLLVDEELHRFLTEQGIVETVGNLSKMWMGVPLKIGGKVIGVVVLQTYKDEVKYTFDDLDIFNFVAEAISLGVGRRKAEEDLKEKLSVIENQQGAILELSTPVIKIWEGVLVIPLIGVLDSRRAEHLAEELLAAITATQSRIAIIDITGVSTVDSSIANHLIKTVESVRLLGAGCVVTGIRPEVAQSIIYLGIDIGRLETRSTLAEGLKWAFSVIGGSGA